MRKLALALSFLLLSSHAWALDVAGVNVAPTVAVRQKTLALNGKALGTVRSPALARGVLLIWFGEKPADGGLKKGMLGNGLGGRPAPG